VTRRDCIGHVRGCIRRGSTFRSTESFGLILDISASSKWVSPTPTGSTAEATSSCHQYDISFSTTTSSSSTPTPAIVSASGCSWPDVSFQLSIESHYITEFEASRTTSHQCGGVRYGVPLRCGWDGFSTFGHDADGGVDFAGGG